MMNTSLTDTELFTQAEDKMQKAIQSLQHELASLRTGRANATLLDRVHVDYYGTATSLKHMANISVVDSQTLSIQPFDKGQIPAIEKAIQKADLGLSPVSDSSGIRLNIPALTEERRKDMVKQVKRLGEDFRVAVRNVRRDLTDGLDKYKKDANISEDEHRRSQEKAQKLTDKYTAEVDKLVTAKEKDLLSV
ncbi:MAG: ribosome recycling factor [Vampirovibrionales bacterium]